MLTEQQLNKRLGRFTASSNYKLVTRDRKGRPYGLTYDSYVVEKYLETVTGEYQTNFSNVSTDWGDTYEPIALVNFELEYDLEVIDVGFHACGDHAGATPDGMVKDKGMIVEIKCPHKERIFKEYLAMKDAADLKKKCKNYYWQMVFQMITMDVGEGVFVTFDPRHESKNLHTVHVPLIKSDRDEIMEALDAAIEYKLKLLDAHKKMYG